MFFGMTNSPSTFQTMMNDVFRTVIAEGIVIVYLDDILIFTKTEEEHERAVQRVLKILAEHKLFLHLEKCEFHRKQIEYLGLVISENTVAMDPVKVAGVREWPTPESQTDVQAFVGFVNFYRCFIQDFSTIARPLFDLTQSDHAWNWGTKEQEAFERLKMAVTTAPILASPQDSEPFCIEADSSDFTSGAILSQKLPGEEKWHPVAFYSKSLSPVERNYEIHDKEMLAIIRTLKEWRHFLKGARYLVEIWTDHKNLEYFMTAKKLNRRQARWSLYLARFDFKLIHRPRHSMGKPDALLWRPDHGKGASDNEDVILLRLELIVVRALEGLHLEGPERDMLREIRQGNQKGDQKEPVAKAARKLQQTSSKTVRSAEWLEDDGVLRFRGKIYIPQNSDLRRWIVSLCHDTKVAGHPRRWKMLELVSRNYWWPQMSRYVRQYVCTCDLCLRTKPIRQAPVGELHPLRIPDLRWDVLSVDFIVELPLSSGHDAVMTVVDSVLKRAHFIPTHTTMTAEGAARLFLHQVWKLHGLPKYVVSDCGPQFVARFTRELYRLLEIKLVSSTAWHP